jgi:TfoX/Sxy family transcriptional regulator of competence genes
MAYDEKLAERMRALLEGKRGITEKKMFGGIAILCNGKMCCGVLKDDLVARVGADGYDKALAKPHVRPMDFTGRPMKGYVYVAPAALRDKRSLQRWLDVCLAHASTL